jgi:hypothetical protein
MKEKIPEIAIRFAIVRTQLTNQVGQDDPLEDEIGAGVLKL